MSCYPCHYDEARTFADVESKGNVREMSCNGCHVKDMPDGQHSHYYYWTRQPYDHNNKVYTQLFDDFTFVPASGATTASIRWYNKAMPHVIGLCPELIFTFEIMGSDSGVLGTTSFRVNRKNDHDTMMLPFFGNKKLGGIVGAETPSYGEQYDYPIKIAKRGTASLLHMRVIKKAQYWFEDSTALKTFDEIRPIHQ